MPTTPNNKKRVVKKVKCLDCPSLATKILKDFKVGLCDNHANKLLTAALLMKIINKK